MSQPKPLSSDRWRRLMAPGFHHLQLRLHRPLQLLDRRRRRPATRPGYHLRAVGLLGGLFFVGYVLFQVPSATFAERRSVKRLMFWSLLVWGVLAAAQGVLPTFSLLSLSVSRLPFKRINKVKLYRPSPASPTPTLTWPRHSPGPSAGT